MKKRYPEKKKILLVNITRLGDMLQATPTIAGLKLENPGCHITVLVEKQFSEVCKLLPGIDEVVSIDLSMVVRSLAREQDGIIDAYEYVSQMVDDMKGRNFDYCLNMSSSAYTALLLNLIGVPRSGGWSSDEQGYRRIESSWAQLFATSVFHQNRQYNSLNLVDVFRCSADVHEHPKKLLIEILPEALQKVDAFIGEAGFTNTGPLIALQAGASQAKRQWSTDKFVRLAKKLISEANARIVLTGTAKESHIIDPIMAAVSSPNLVSAAGKTNIPELAALLKRSDLCVTGDTGTMHISVAAGTPVVSMFLASAFGFETGPYGQDHIVLQPVIGCGPCNPNKACAKTDCHDQIDPELVAEIVALRLKGPIERLPEGLCDASRVLAYRSYFDQFGFCNLALLHAAPSDTISIYREAYRKVWLEDIGGFNVEGRVDEAKGGHAATSRLKRMAPSIEGLEETLLRAEEGLELLSRLVRAINDHRTPASEFGAISHHLGEIDRYIEELGFQYPHLGPLNRMFVFGKENLQGSDALSLASEMGGVYQDLIRRGRRLAQLLG